MEYGRRRKRRGRKPEGNGAGYTLVTVLLFALAGYLIVFAGAGKRIAEGAKQLGSLVFPRKEEPLPTALFIATASPEVSPSPTGTPAGETRKVALPGISIYMLSIGSFQDRASADAAAEELKAKGAAGCVSGSEGDYTVIAAAYSEESDAENVRARLMEEGFDCRVTSVIRDGCELEITASPERLLPIGTAFAIAPETVIQLDELSRELDAEAKSTEYGLGVLGEIKRNVLSAVSGLGATEGGDAWLMRIGGYLTELGGLIDGAIEKSGSRAELSSSVKELRLRSALLYAEMLANE